MKTIIVGVVAAAGVLGMLVLLRGGLGGEPAAADAAAHAKAKRGPAPDVVLSIVPGASSAPRAAEAAARPLTPLVIDLLRRRNFKATYERLKDSASRSAEETYVLAEILRACARIADRKNAGLTRKIDRNDARAQFVASLPEKDAFRARRLQAYEEMDHSPCADFPVVEVTEADIQALLASAAAAGDPKARASLLERELFAQWRNRGALPEISDQQLATVKEIVASGDPVALADALGVLTMPLANFSLRAGPNDIPVDVQAIHGAGSLLACDFGGLCGADSPQLLRACATRGQCAANDLREFLFYYQLSPSASQQVNEYYRHLSRAARLGDWSYFTFHRGPAPSAAIFAGSNR